MKKVLLAITLLLGLNFVSAQNTELNESDQDALEAMHKKLESRIMPNWEELFKTALVRSKKEKKPILVFFTGSDWCGPCKKLHHDVMETESFKKFSDDNFVLYQADFPRNKDLVPRSNRDFNKQLQKRFKQRSFPTILIIDDNGNLIGRKDGLNLAQVYPPFFREVIAQYNESKK